MTGISVKIKFGELTPELITEEFRRFRTNTTKMSNDILLKQIKDEVVLRRYVVSGDLQESWHEGDLEETINLTRVSAESDDIAAAVLENKANPAVGGIVNVYEIFDWAKRKGITPRSGNLKQFAWVVAKSIGEKGQKFTARPWHNAQKKAARKINKLWDVELDKFIDRLNKK